MAELRAFVAVAEELHFSRAARRLGVAGPSLSQTLRRLEHKLGGVLAERTPRSVSLTEAGHDLLPRARDILERMDLARRAVGELSRPAAAATLRVGIMSNGFAELTAPIMATFRAAHPRVRVVVSDVTTRPGNVLLSGEVDVLLARPPISEQHDERLRFEELVAEPRSVLLPAGHRLAAAPAVGIGDLLGDTFVRVGPGMPDITDYWSAADARDGEPVRMGIDAHSVQDVLCGVAYLDNVITSIPSVLRFYCVPGVVSVPLRDVSAATMAVLTMVGDPSPVVRAFRDTVHTVAAELVDIVPGARLTAAAGAA